MKIQQSKNIEIRSSQHNKPILIDYTYNDSVGPMPLVVFVHGFKGFKDWGQFNLLAQYFAKASYAFLKMSFSHNGTTPDSPEDFNDLEAFGNNNFLLELGDLDDVINYVHANAGELNVDINRIYLIGHSRGGGITLIKGHEDDRIAAIATLAAVNTMMGSFTDEMMQQWKSEEVIHVYNGRTDQQMPMFYQLAETTLNNKHRLDIERILKQYNKPLLITHGTADATLPVAMAYAMHEWNPASKLFIIDEANHTFGGQHPYNEKQLPAHTQLAAKAILDFFNQLC